ncbi:MAG TPA: Gfo/Idh/MocA family oxidoreductase [Bryobacteraceae bacterium]|nr:Gfo/Idh/MocA family oxidoreductase [Bryobacteraceae bacterium]
MSSSDRPKRREFLTTASLALAAGAQATAQTSAPRSGPLRIGCLNVHNYSHLLPLWAPLMNPRADKKEIQLTGMHITHCWEIDPARSAEFAKIYGCEAVRNFDDMLGKVDAIISGGYYHYPWNHILHQPYLEAGLPNLINRPFASSLAKARKMLDTARKHGATILCPSAYEYTEAISRARKWAGGKKILCYSATNSFDEYPTHGVHGVYMIHRAIVEAGNPVVSVAYQAKNWYSIPGVMTFEHQGASGNSFLGSLHQTTAPWGTLAVHTPEDYGGRQFDIQPGVGFPFSTTEAWAPTIWAFERMARYREMPQSYDGILEKTRIFLAGFRSILDGGKPVRLEEVPEDWESPAALPTKASDPTVEMFRKKFG